MALTATLDSISACDGSSNRVDAHCKQVVEVVQQRLEAESTPPSLLQPLIGLLLACGAACPDAIDSHFHDIVDLLLGWSLDPDLSHAGRCVDQATCFLSTARPT